MSDPEIHDALEHLKVVRHVCDLDLLVFLHRHRRAFLGLDQLAVYMGCDRERVAKSLDHLIAEGLVIRRQKPPSAVPMLLLVSNGLQGQRLATLLAIASTRHGRLRILQALATAPPSEDHVHSPGEPPVKGNHA